jgi:hypothetical protein
MVAAPPKLKVHAAGSSRRVTANASVSGFTRLNELRECTPSSEQPHLREFAFLLEDAQHLGDPLDTAGFTLVAEAGHRLTRVVTWPGGRCVSRVHTIDA